MKEKLFDNFMELYKEETQHQEENLKDKQRRFLISDFIEIMSKTTKKFLSQLGIERNQIFIIDTIPDRTFKIIDDIVYEVITNPQKNPNETKEAFLRITAFAKYMDENNLTAQNIIPVNKPTCICRKTEFLTLEMEEIYKSGDYMGDKIFAINFQDKSIGSYMSGVNCNIRKTLSKTDINFCPFCGKNLKEN